MPVINFEYTGNLNIDSQIKPFLKNVHEALVEHIATDLRTCRTSINKLNNFYIGDGADNLASILLHVVMLPGRTKETKDKTGDALLALVNETFKNEIQAHDTQIRVYLTETEIDYYYGLEH